MSMKKYVLVLDYASGCPVHDYVGFSKLEFCDNDINKLCSRILELLNKQYYVNCIYETDSEEESDILVNYEYASHTVAAVTIYNSETKEIYKKYKPHEYEEGKWQEY